MADGSPFPDRDLILILTFSVLFVTLVGIGLTLPAVAWGLGLANAGRRERQAEREEEYKARRRAIVAAIDQIDALAHSRKLPQAVVEPMRVHHRNRLEDIERHNDGNERDKKLAELSDELELALIETERGLVNRLYLEDELKGDARRRIERELDLREALFANVHATE